MTSPTEANSDISADETANSPARHAEDAHGSRPRGFAERITGTPDSADPDGLVTLNDLPDRTGDASDLSAIADAASRYGDSPPS